jgi:dTMP kinase
MLPKAPTPHRILWTVRRLQLQRQTREHIAIPMPTLTPVREAHGQSAEAKAPQQPHGDLKAVLITFSGIDGAGKSSQTECVRQYFESRGLRPLTLWSRGGYTPAIDWLKTQLRRVLSRTPVSGDVDGRSRYFRMGLVRRLWLWVALLDLIWVYAVRIRLRIHGGRPVVCDRYIWDSLIDFRIMFPQEQVEDWILWRLLKRLAARPAAAFLMQVPPEISAQRSAAKGESHTEPLAVVMQRLGFYENLARRTDFHVVSGMGSIEDSSHRVLSTIADLGRRNSGRKVTPAI